MRRLDPRTLRVTATLRLRLPFELVPGDRAFLPNDAVEADRSLWVSTDRGVLARIAPDLSRVVAMVRLPLDAGSRIAAADGAVWSAEQLAGVYRIDPATNAVVARIRVGRCGRRVAVQGAALVGGEVFALGIRTGEHRVSTGESVLARIDPAANRVEAVTALPPGVGSLFAHGAGALWVAGPDSVYRVDPGSGRVSDRYDARGIAALTVAGGHA